MNVGSVIFGVLIGIGLVIGLALYMAPQTGAPTPQEVCNEELDGTGWEPNGVATDRDNKTVHITCERNGTVEMVKTDLNAVIDMGGEFSL